MQGPRRGFDEDVVQIVWNETAVDRLASIVPAIRYSLVNQNCSQVKQKIEQVPHLRSTTRNTSTDMLRLVAFLANAGRRV